RAALAVAVRLAHHPVADDADPQRRLHGAAIAGIAAVTCSAAVSAATASAAGAPWQGPPAANSAKLSAWLRSASNWARSPSAGSMTSHRSLPRVPNTSAHTASPAGQHRPRETDPAPAAEHQNIH